VRHSVARAIVTTSLVALLLVACSDDSNDAAGSTTVPGATLAPGETLAPTIAPSTTFAPDCGQMPRVGDISTAVGVPLSDGQIVGSGTCQYLGLNDQSKSVTLSVFTDPVDQAAFTDLQASLGAPTPYTDPALAGAQVGVDSTLFITANGAVYTVLTNVTGGALSDQVALSAAVLQTWLTP
jgi:uncharacterized lipoprotein NlpE involved in copper resistance